MRGVRKTPPSPAATPPLSGEADRTAVPPRAPTPVPAYNRPNATLRRRTIHQPTKQNILSSRQRGTTPRRLCVRTALTARTNALIGNCAACDANINLNVALSDPISFETIDIDLT